MTRSEVLAWLDIQWDSIIATLAKRDPVSAHLIRMMADQRIAQGAALSMAPMRAGPFLQPYLDELAHRSWLLVFGSAFRMLAIRDALLTFDRMLPDPPDAPDDTPPAGPEHAVS